MVRLLRMSARLWQKFEERKIRKGKARIEILLARSLKGKKKAFCPYVRRKRTTKENLGPF